MSGTTVGCIILQPNCMLVANVGDSAVILGTSNEEAKKPEVIAQVLTRNHTPHDEDERKRIESLGGLVQTSGKGKMRVIWEQKCPNGPCQVDRLPRLNMTRSLGDLWSAIPGKNEYLISPIPDVYIHHLDPFKDKYIILGSDGLWDVIEPQRCIDIVDQLWKSGVKDTTKASKVVMELVDLALKEWNNRMLKADDVSVIIVFVKRCTVTLRDDERKMYSPSGTNNSGLVPMCKQTEDWQISQKV